MHAGTTSQPPPGSDSVSTPRNSAGPPRLSAWQRTVQFNQATRDDWMAQAAARVPAGARVLDVGAGRGPYRFLFRHCDYKSHDFGQEPGTLGQYVPLDFQSDIVSIPVPDASFDVIICTEVLEHVPEPIAAVREMARILAPGGTLLLSAPLGSELHQEPYHFYGGYTPHWYRRFLPQFGIHLESVTPNHGFFSFFAQEGRRFSAYLDPRRTWRRTVWWPVLAAIWAATLPLFRLALPLAARTLDQLQLEQTCTIGYHVVGRKVKGEE